MKKETRKQKDDRELQILTQVGLSPEQLKVIRKLQGATYVNGGQENRRTIEAVLQGRRQNPRILQFAIENAKEQLGRLNKVMAEIDQLLNSNVTT